MSVKKQIPSLCKLSSFYEEIPEEFLNETDVDKHLYHKIFDISKSQHRTVWDSRGSNKKSFAVKLFQFCDLKAQQRYILQEVKMFKKELSSLVDSLRDFLKTFADAGNCLQIPLPKPRIELQSTESKDNLFAHYYNDIIEHLNIQFCILLWFWANNSCVCSMENTEIHGKKFNPTAIVNLNHPKQIIPTKTDNTQKI